MALNTNRARLAAVLAAIMALSLGGAFVASAEEESVPVGCTLTNNVLTCPLPEPPAPVTVTETVTETVTATQTVTATPSASPSPSPSPSPTPTTTAPPAQGFPTPATTGPRSASTATQGSLATSSNGQVIERLTINGRLTIQHDNVTVRDVTVMGTGTYMIYIRSKADGKCPTNARIEYTEVDGKNAPADAIAVYGPCGFTFDRGEIRNTGRGLRLVNNATVSNSYVYTARTWDGAHRTAIGHNGGSNLRVINNALYCELTGCSSAVSFYGDFAQVDDVLVQGNIMSTTGRYCIHGGSVSSKPYPDGTNVRILDNHFSTSLGAKCGVSGPLASFEGGVRGNEYRGNVWHETGQPA
jgi:hypothetical protein